MAAIAVGSERERVKREREHRGRPWVGLLGGGRRVGCAHSSPKTARRDRLLLCVSLSLSLSLCLSVSVCLSVSLLATAAQRGDAVREEGRGGGGGFREAPAGGGRGDVSFASVSLKDATEDSVAADLRRRG